MTEPKRLLEWAAFALFFERFQPGEDVVRHVYAGREGEIVYVLLVDIPNAPKRILSVDPGRMHLITARIFEKLPIVRNGNITEAVRNFVEMSEVIEYSSAQFAQDSRQAHSRITRDRNSKKHPSILLSKSTAPSLKISNFSVFSLHLEARFRIQDQLYWYQKKNEPGRSHQETARRKAMDRVIKMLVGPFKREEVLCFYGDFDNNSNSKGYNMSPVREIYKRLQKFAVVHETDEGFTSQVHCFCGGKLREMTYRNENDVQYQTRWSLYCERCDEAVGRDKNACVDILIGGLSDVFGVARPSEMPATSKRKPDQSKLDSIRSLYRIPVGMIVN